jgi:hypothetical protein
MCRKLGIGCVKSTIEYLEDRVKIGSIIVNISPLRERLCETNKILNSAH